MAAKIRTNDEVIVIAGKDKNRTGKVLRVINSEKSVKVVVEGVNIHSRHQKAQQQGASGEIIKKEAPIDVSNVAIYNPETKKADKVGFKFEDDGKKVRVFKSSGQPLPETKK